MKAIEISKNAEMAFKEAARLAGLSIECQTKIAMPGRVVYRVTTLGVSQHQLFILGVYFAQLTITAPEDEAAQIALF